MDFYLTLFNDHLHFTDNQHFNATPLLTSSDLRLHRLVFIQHHQCCATLCTQQFSLISQRAKHTFTHRRRMLNHDEWMILWLFMKRFFFLFPFHTVFDVQQNGKYTSDNDWCLIGSSTLSICFSICLNTLIFFYNPFFSLIQLISFKCWNLMWLCGFRLRRCWLLSLHLLVSIHHGKGENYEHWPILYFLWNYYLHFLPRQISTPSRLPGCLVSLPHRIQWGMKNDKIYVRLFFSFMIQFSLSSFVASPVDFIFAKVRNFTFTHM